MHMVTKLMKMRVCGMSKIANPKSNYTVVSEVLDCFLQRQGMSLITSHNVEMIGLRCLAHNDQGK